MKMGNKRRRSSQYPCAQANSCHDVQTAREEGNRNRTLAARSLIFAAVLSAALSHPTSVAGFTTRKNNRPGHSHSILSAQILCHGRRTSRFRRQLFTGLFFATEESAVLESESPPPSSSSRTNQGAERGDSSSLPLLKTANNPITSTIPERPLIIENELMQMKMPPWLRKAERVTLEEMEEELEWLEYKLLENGFPVDDITDIVTGIRLVGEGDRQKTVGCVDFCKLILRLEDDPNSETRIFATKEVLLASIVHYVECISARQNDVYSRVQKAVTHSAMSDQTLKLSPAHSSTPDNQASESSVSDNSSNDRNTSLATTESSKSLGLSEKSSALQLSQPLSDNSMILEMPELFTEEVLRLARGASVLKRAEILADVILTDSRALTPSEYSDFRDMLLSMMQDYRALAIRCVASLYRLEGVLEEVSHGSAQYIDRSPQVVQVARHSMKVYASLASRLGIHRLKSQIEALSFQILYPKQYQAVSTLFQEKGKTMNAVSKFLATEISQMLYQDQSLMSQLADLQVTVRVKEPYSFWKKLLRKRLAEREKTRSLSASDSKLSLLDVQDGVALRVILSARQWTSNETRDAQRSRERMLCYYVHHLIRSKWPVKDESRVKDYIANPKANGYQSLHFSSSIIRNNQEFPFEVQVRSEEMHRVAEYGVAAHWDYKLQKKLPPAPVDDDIDTSGIILDEIEKSDNEAPVLTSINVGNAYIDTLVMDQQNLVTSQVYVFLAGSSSTLEEGTILTLPVGSKVHHIITKLKAEVDIGDDDDELIIWKNGRRAYLGEVLGNGDAVLIFKGKKTNVVDVA